MCNEHITAWMFGSQRGGPKGENLENKVIHSSFYGTLCSVAKGRNNKTYIRIWVQTPFKTLLPQPPENKGTDASLYLISMNQYSKWGLILMYSELRIWRGQNKTNWLTRAETSLEGGRLCEIFLYQNHLFYSQYISVGSTRYLQLFLGIIFCPNN